jgi:hypothetical protein
MKKKQLAFYNGRFATQPLQGDHKKLHLHKVIRI